MLTISHLRKEYSTVVAVDDVSFAVRRGEIFGLLGPNGAGKTTIIRIVLNIIKPDRGGVWFDGKLYSTQIANSIGYLPEERGLYQKNKLLRTLQYFASLRGLNARSASLEAHRWLERFGLLDRIDRKIEELSKGNQQKLQFIIAIMHNPDLVILDEPFSGLDPVNQSIMKDVFMELKSNKKAVIFSTHQMDQAERLCDEICLIDRGHKVLDGEIHEVKKRYGKNSVHLEFDGDGSFLKTMKEFSRADVYENFAELELTDSVSNSSVLQLLLNKLEIRKFEVKEPSLHSIFINVVGMPQTQGVAA